MNTNCVKNLKQKNNKYLCYSKKFMWWRLRFGARLIIDKLTQK